MAVDEVIHVVAMRHRVMPASGAMLVAGIVARAGMLRSACVRVGGAYLNNMLIDVVAMGLMQMAVVKIIDMVVVLHRDMSAAGAVDVRMPFVNLVFR